MKNFQLPYLFAYGTRHIYVAYTANSIKVDIDNSQMYDLHLGDKNDKNNHSFIHEDATNIMLKAIFVIPQGH